MWWVCRDGVHLPGTILPRGSYSARGWGGHLLLGVPERDLLVVHRAQTEVRPFRTVDQFTLGRIVQAVLDALR